MHICCISEHSLEDSKLFRKLIVYTKPKLHSNQRLKSNKFFQHFLFHIPTFIIENHSNDERACLQLLNSTYITPPPSSYNHVHSHTLTQKKKFFPRRNLAYLFSSFPSVSCSASSLKMSIYSPPSRALDTQHT